MFAALGDKPLQESIRARNPKGFHCFILKESPTGCVELPRDLGDYKAGQVCPNNPYFKHPDKILDLETQRRLVDLALQSHRAFSIHGLSEHSLRVEVTLAYAYQRWLEERQLIGRNAQIPG